MCKKVIMVISVLLLMGRAAVADDFLTLTDSQILDFTERSYSMSLPQSDGSCYIMGTGLQLQTENWFAHVSKDGTIDWTISCPDSHFYRGAVQVNDTAYLIIDEYGMPVEQRKPYLLPISANGVQGDPIALPAWMSDATIMSVDAGILVYSHNVSPLKVALLDTSFRTLWSLETTKVPRNFYLTDACASYENGYVLLAFNQNERENALLFIDEGGEYAKTQVLRDEGAGIAIVAEQDAFHILIARRGMDTSVSYDLLTTDHNGICKTKKTILSNSPDVTFNTLLLCKQGYLLGGSRANDTTQPKALLAFTPFAGEKLQIQDIPEITALEACQFYMDTDHAIMVLGSHTGESGTADGRIICNWYLLNH